MTFHLPHLLLILLSWGLSLRVEDGGATVVKDPSGSENNDNFDEHHDAESSGREGDHGSQPPGPEDVGNAIPVPLIGVAHAGNNMGGLHPKNSSSKLYYVVGVVVGLSVIGLLCASCYLSRLSQQVASKSGSSTSADYHSAERLPNKIRYAYCLPTMSTLPMTAFLSVFGMSFYSQRGAEISAMAVAMAMARSFDVVSDPVMSYITDSSRHPLGRRLPFMLVGAPLYAVFLTALLAPPFLESQALGIWFTIMYIGFFLTNTICNIPYDALGPELTENSFERSRLFFLSGLFDGFGTLLAFGFPEIGYKIGLWAKLTASMCVDKQDVLSKCSIGFSCAEFNEHGTGHEFVQNITLINNQSLLNGVKSVINYDCDQTTYARPEEATIFCDCVNVCLAACNNYNRYYGFGLTGLFFGLWYFTTSYWCCNQVRERPPPPTGRPRAPPLVPSMLGVLRNPAFATLLPAWACDAVGQAIFLTLCPYFVMYVVAPEFQEPGETWFGVDCKEGTRGVSTSWSYDRRCNSQIILGACVGFALLAALASSPFWLWLVRRNGKVYAWLCWSFAMGVTNVLFLFVGRNAIASVLLVCCLNGIPLSAKFLADAILADVIDYDEFLTGTRNEATYTMFKSFLPKIMAIPASALPLSVMNAMGHRPASNGRLQLQPDAVRISIVVMAGGFTTIAALAGWFIKRGYPLVDEDILQKVANGIVEHRDGKKARDPLTGVEFSIAAYTDAENTQGVWAIDHFDGLDVVNELEKDCIGKLNRLRCRVSVQLAGSLIFIASSLYGLITSLPLLKNVKLSFIPTIFAIFVGVALLMVGWSSLRLRAVMQMLQNPPSLELIRKVKEHRINLHALATAPRVSTVEQSSAQ